MSETTQRPVDQPYVSWSAGLQRFGGAVILMLVIGLTGWGILLADGPRAVYGYGTFIALIMPTWIRTWIRGTEARRAAEIVISRNEGRETSSERMVLTIGPWIAAGAFSALVAFLEQFSEHMFFPGEGHPIIDAGAAVFVVGLIVYGIVYRLEGRHDYVRSTSAQNFLDGALRMLGRTTWGKRVLAAKPRPWAQAVMPALAHAVLASLLTMGARAVFPAWFSHWQGAVAIALLAGGIAFAPNAIPSFFSRMESNFHPDAKLLGGPADDPKADAAQHGEEPLPAETPILTPAQIDALQRQLDELRAAQRIDG